MLVWPDVPFLRVCKRSLLMSIGMELCSMVAFKSKMDLEPPRHIFTPIDFQIVDIPKIRVG